jgi:hypothetical protein
MCLILKGDSKENLKALSSMMAPTEISLIRWVVINERGAKVFSKKPPVPHPVRAL